MNLLHPRSLTILSFGDASRRFREFEAVISIENPVVGKRLRYAPEIGAPEQLVLAFDDIDEDFGDDNLTLPTLSDVRRALEFSDRYRGSSILVHCQAGKCRSPAVALAILAHRLGNEREPEAVEHLIRIRPVSFPNLLYLAAADRELEREGALLAAWLAVENASTQVTEWRTRKSAIIEARRHRGRQSASRRIRPTQNPGRHGKRRDESESLTRPR